MPTLTLATIDLKAILKSLQAMDQKVASALGLEPSRYRIEAEGEARLLTGKLIRMGAAQSRFRAFLRRLDELLVAVEYAHGNVVFEHRGEDYSEAFKRKLFLALAADSVRSSLDILATAIAWFFDLPGAQEMGFTWRGFLEPLKPLSESLFKKADALYKSRAFVAVKEFRDTEKHRGLGTPTIRTKLSRKCHTTTVSLRRPLDLDAFDGSIAELVDLTIGLANYALAGFETHPTGFDSPRDRYAKIGPGGRLFGPRTKL